MKITITRPRKIVPDRSRNPGDTPAATALAVGEAMRVLSLKVLSLFEIRDGLRLIWSSPWTPDGLKPP
jgi:hypothetical protein